MSWYYKLLHCSEALILSCVQKLTPHISVLCSCASVYVYQAAANNIFTPGPHPELLVLPAQLGSAIRNRYFCNVLHRSGHGAGLPGDSISPVYYYAHYLQPAIKHWQHLEQVSWVSVQNATHFKPPSPGNKIKCM